MSTRDESSPHEAPSERRMPSLADVAELVHAKLTHLRSPEPLAAYKAGRRAVCEDVLEFIFGELPVSPADLAARVAALRVSEDGAQAVCSYPGCGEPREHYLHSPAADCLGCAAPQDHHEFQPQDGAK